MKNTKDLTTFLRCTNNQKKKDIKKTCISIMLALLTVGSALGLSTVNGNASSHHVGETLDGSWKAVAGNAGLYGSAAYLTVSGGVAFCLQANKAAQTGTNSEVSFEGLGINSNQKHDLSLIANFGYFSQPSNVNYVLTQNLIWKYLGWTCGYVSSSHGYSTLASQNAWQAGVLAKVNAYKTGVSFNNGNYEVNVGQTITITDTNNVLSSMQVVSGDGLQVSINGNQLSITGTVNASDTSTIVLKKPISNEGVAYVVRSGNSQAVSVLKLSDPYRSGLTVKVNKNYQVAFNGNTSSSGSMTNQTFVYNQAQNLKSNGFSKIGHTFGGWNTNTAGTGSNYSNGQSVKNLTSPNSTITLYAKWVNTKPEITTPVITNPNETTNSNIPPFIDGGKLIVQKGDELDAIKHFSANDKEDGVITNKIVITDNPIPLDSNKITTESGEYIVTSSVTDLGGLTTTAKLTVIVNEPPVIEAQDRWFLQDQTVDRDNLLSQVVANDKEDGDLISKVVIDYIKYHDGRVVNNPTSFDTTFNNETGVDDIGEKVSEIKYTVTDKYKASVTTTAKLSISRDVQKFKAKRKEYIRYINLDNISTLEATSIWKTNSTLNSRLLSSLNKSDTSQAKAVYSYTTSDVQEIKTWLKDNKPSQAANEEYITKYLNPHKIRGGVN